MNKKQFKNITIYGIIIILVITAILFLFKATEVSFSSALDTGILSDYSAFAFGFIGILLTVLNLLLAIQNFNFQENSFEKQKFESHFFTLLQIYRDNYNNAQSLFGLNNDGKDLFPDFYNKFINIQLNATTSFYLYKNIRTN
ncbi:MULTISPECIES: hypothetical protein [unclassified Chryseobacterium]|uniref:hypothetical protein n=1 Tax=unclassified Chryseobacterium TaxID=2593645 RepID=UPI00100ACA57|nr:MULTISPECIES: hypothetical protein [unclassified Chryseobacterium]RXM50585.1 hypothetical protein BOQ64_17745 [Chryseobacterium sp. CH25]RXM63221.1 hypothetical protein BOQ60_17950 [Chryseobacterium sp. CH1]